MIAKFIEDDCGATSIEYAVILILCSTAMIAALYDVRATLNGMIQAAADALAAAV